MATADKELVDADIVISPALAILLNKRKRMESAPNLKMAVQQALAQIVDLKAAMDHKVDVVEGDLLLISRSVARTHRYDDPCFGEGLSPSTQV